MTGMSGTGKSSALAELGRRGYRVVDTGDPGWREYREDVESSDELHRGEWLWVEERVTGLLGSDDGRSLFVEGCVRNQSKFYDRFESRSLYLEQPRPFGVVGNNDPLRHARTLGRLAPRACRRSTAR